MLENVKAKTTLQLHGYRIQRTISYIISSILLAPIKRIITHGLWRVIRTLQTPEPSPLKSQLPDLCPTTYAENIDAPSAALDEYLKRASIREIAITAPYSGGKSSFILSYFRHRYFYRVKYVSLAAFLEQTREQSGDRSGNLKNIQEIDLCDIELNLLQQIRQIPPLGFRRWEGTLYAIVALVVTVTGYYLHQSHYAVESLLPPLRWNRFPDCVQLLIGTISLAAIILTLRDLYCLIDRFTLRKINVFKFGVEVDGPKSTSVLNNHINEILYSFCKNMVDIVVFEDLDRFKREDIFIKLKELNKNINDCEQVGRTVRFLYAIGDDVFERYNRTKFFDATVSIIPATDTHKSAAHLKHLVKSHLGDGAYERLKDLIDSVALYVLDMRLLNSIVADYSITLKTLLQTNPNIDRRKLFGFVVYKNYFPDDFSKLHNKEGIFYALTCYENIKSFRSVKAKELQARKDDLLEDIRVERENYVNNRIELNMLYFLRALSRDNLDLLKLKQINNTNPSKFYSSQDLTFTNKQLDVVVTEGHYNNHHKVTVFPIGQKEVDVYNRRLKIIEQQHDVNTLKIELQLLNHKISVIQGTPLRDLIRDDTELIERKLRELKVLQDVGAGKEPEHIPPLLRVLLARNSLDEHYMLYSNHCHPEDDLSETALFFLRAVQEFKSFDIDAPLKNDKAIQAITDKMNCHDYDSPAAINYDFIDYVLRNKPNYRFNICDSLIRLPQAIRIAYNLWEKSKEQTAKWLAEGWNNVCTELIHNGDLQDSQKLNFLISLMSAKIDEGGDSALQNEADTLAPYLSEKSYLFTDIRIEEISNIPALFQEWKKMGVRFRNLDICLHDTDYMDYCLTYDLYELNEVNIKAISQHLDLPINAPGCPDYSDIKELANDFSQRLEACMDETLHLITDGSMTVRKEADIIDIINHPEIDDDRLLTFIENFHFTIDDIKTLVYPKEILPALIQYNRISVDWGNLMYIQDTLGADDCIPILIAHYKVLCTELKTKDPDEINEINRWIPLASLPLSIFEAYITSIEYCKPDISEFNHEQIKYLIDSEHLALSQSALKSLDVNYQDLAIEYIKRNSKRLIEERVFSVELKISEPLLLAVIRSTEINEDAKHDIYQSQSDHIGETFWDNIPELTPEVCEQFLRILDETERKLSLLISQIPYMDKVLLQKQITSFDEGLSPLFRDQKTCIFDITDDREAILKRLKECYFIQSYKIEKRGEIEKFKVTLDKKKDNT